MKTIITTTALKLRMALVVSLMALMFASCTNKEDEPLAPSSRSVSISEAKVTFTYTVPEELFKYAEITVCRNTDDGSDAVWEPMLSPSVSVTYNLNKFPVTAPVVFVYDYTNRPATGVNVDWDITMDIEAVLTIDGKKQVLNHQEIYSIDGNLGSALESLMNNVKDRTYAVKISTAGDIAYVH